MKKIVKYFLRGLLYTVPLAVTGAFAIWAFNKIEAIIPTLMPRIMNEMPVVFPGIGIVLIFLIIVCIGFIGSLIIKTPINSFFRKLLKKAPILETIYSSVKDIMNTFVGKKKGFDHPVLIKIYENSTIERIGFITQDDLSSLNIKKGKVLVYLPHSYAFSGQLFVVDKKYITQIDSSSAEIMKLIVSGGITQVNK
tara:strand:+ start:4418 stop:5002 length:585 start_codon:yes stop_codon:yes gene_type:complete